MKSAFSQNIIKARKYLGLTQMKAAELLNIKYQRLGAYEEGRADPPIYLITTIIKTYGIENIEAFLNDYDFVMNDTPVKNGVSVLEKKFNRATPTVKEVVKILLGMEE